MSSSGLDIKVQAARSDINRASRTIRELESDISAYRRLTEVLANSKSPFVFQVRSTLNLHASSMDNVRFIYSDSLDFLSNAVTSFEQCDRNIAASMNSPLIP